MKVLKVYDSAHQTVKVEAAKQGKTAVQIASELIELGYQFSRSKIKPKKEARP